MFALDQLNEILTDCCGHQSILTIQPGGNHGDELIYRGFNEFIAQTTVNPIQFRSDAMRDDEPRSFPSPNLLEDLGAIYDHSTYLRHLLLTDFSAVYIHGGGNFNDLWGGGIGCYQAACRYFNCPIIVGPQSCQFHDTNPTSVFRGVSNNTHFFCRERYSYDIISEAVSDLDHVNVYLEDDTALYLDGNALPVHDTTEEYTLVSMRGDKESTSPLIKHDISGPVRVRDISVQEDTFADFVSGAARAKKIFTDRLHVAILSVILGKPVVWHEVGYHKSRGVFEYSLKDVSNLEFVYSH